LGGTLLLAAPYFWANQGAAMPLALFLLLLAAALSSRAPTIARLLARAAVWVRADSALGVALLALLLLWEERRVPWRYALAAGAVIVAGVGLAWIYYGSPLPNTLGRKTPMAGAAPGGWGGVRVSLWA